MRFNHMRKCYKAVGFEFGQGDAEGLAVIAREIFEQFVTVMAAQTIGAVSCHMHAEPLR